MSLQWLVFSVVQSAVLQRLTQCVHCRSAGLWSSEWKSSAGPINGPRAHRERERDIKYTQGLSASKLSVVQYNEDDEEEEGIWKRRSKRVCLLSLQLSVG